MAVFYPALAVLAGGMLPMQAAIIPDWRASLADQFGQPLFPASFSPLSSPSSQAPQVAEAPALAA